MLVCVCFAILIFQAQSQVSELIYPMVSFRFVSFRFNARDRSFNRGGIADVSCHVVSCHLILSYAILQYILALELFSVALASN